MTATGAGEFKGGGAPNGAGGGCLLASPGDARRLKKSSSAPSPRTPNGEAAVVGLTVGPATATAPSTGMSLGATSASTFGVSPPNKSPREVVLRSTKPVGAVAFDVSVNVSDRDSTGGDPNADADTTRWKPWLGSVCSAVDTASTLVVEKGSAPEEPTTSSDPRPCASGPRPCESAAGQIIPASSSWSLATSGHSSSLSDTSVCSPSRADPPVAVSGAAIAPPHAPEASLGVVATEALTRFYSKVQRKVSFPWKLL